MTTNTTKTIQLTQQGYDEIVTELADLKLKEQTAIERVSTARQHGDLSENAEYHAAKDDLAFISSRIEELEGVMAQAKVLKHSKATSQVKLGSIVTVKHNSKKVTYHIVTAWEADPMERRISNDSPLGKALIGKKQSEQFTVTVPAGPQQYEIIEIQ